MTRGREIALTAIAGLLLAGLLSIRVGAPWRFVHDDNGACFQAIATTHLRAGLARTHGQDFWIRRGDGQLVPYLHHPPLLGLTIASAYHLTGRADPLITRLVPALFHMLGFAGFCVLARRVFPDDPGPRALAAFIYALVPMSSFFGKMPDHEPVGLGWAVWGMVAMATLRERPPARGGWLVAGAACWFMAGFAAWAAHAVLAAVWALLLLEWRRPASRKPLVVLACAGLASLALVLAQIQSLGGFPSMARAGGFWTSALRDPRELVANLGRILQFNRVYFANLPAALFLGWLILAIRDEARGRGEPGSPRRFLLAGTAGCALWVLVVARAASHHAYHQFWLLPFVSLGAADLAVRIGRSPAVRPALRPALAWVAAAILLGSTAVTLWHRYSRPGAYAVPAAAWFHATYVSEPWAGVRP